MSPGAGDLRKVPNIVRLMNKIAGAGNTDYWNLPWLFEGVVDLLLLLRRHLLEWVICSQSSVDLSFGQAGPLNYSFELGCK